MNRIKELRNERNINQDVLAKLLGLEVAGVSKLETGRVPLKDDYIIKLANYFGVSTDYLLGNSDERNTVDVSKVQFANNSGLDTEGLTDRDIEELKAQIEFKRKYNKEKKGI